METKSVQSIDRLFDIIEALSNHPNGVNLTELSEEVKLHKSTVHRFLSTLSARGYAMKEPADSRYRLTMRMYEIGSRVLDSMNIMAAAQPYLAQLFDETNEAVHMVVRDKSEIVYIFKEESSANMPRMSSRVGLRGSMYCTGVGKAILAYLPEDEALAIWKDTDIVPYTEKTITTFTEMRAELAHIRELGYAIDNEEHEMGVRCIAAPIFSFSGKPIAAISISTLAARLDAARVVRYARLVKDAAANISLRQGFEPK